MANAIARAREMQAVARGDGLQVAVVVGVAEIGLQHIVVHIAHRKLCLNARQFKGLELQIGHSSRGILCQRLVDTQADLLARRHLS